MLERLLDIEVTEHGTIIEEIELICCMTGFRRRLLVHHIGEGFFRSVELFPIRPESFFVEGRAARAGIAESGQPKKRAVSGERRTMQ